MKKSFAILLIVVFALAGIPAALSVLPHTHGQDFNHSKHSTCPVYQVSQVSFAAQMIVFTSLIISLVSRRYFFHQEILPDVSIPFFLALRGPPTPA